MQQQAEELNTLAWLIQTRMKDHGWSYRDVGERGGLPYGTVAALARKTGQAHPPRPKTIAALAKGLEIPEDIVHACAGEAAGFEVDLPPQYASVRAYVDVWVIAESMKKLSPEMRQVFTATVQALRHADARH